MSNNNKFAMDYIDVATRLVEFREKFPEGSLQPADQSVPFRVEKIGDQVFIVVVAAAYRTPDDPRPGIGMAYEAFPGRTPYTKGSELQNAETSAWGRAIVAALAADTRKGIASAEEVRNRSAEREQPPARQSTRQAERPAQASEGQANQLRSQIKNVGQAKNYLPAEVADIFTERMKKDIRTAGVPELSEFREWLSRQPAKPAKPAAPESAA